MKSKSCLPPVLSPWFISHRHFIANFQRYCQLLLRPAMNRSCPASCSLFFFDPQSLFPIPQSTFPIPQSTFRIPPSNLPHSAIDLPHSALIPAFQSSAFRNRPSAFRIDLPHSNLPHFAIDLPHSALILPPS